MLHNHPCYPDGSLAVHVDRLSAACLHRRFDMQRVSAAVELARRAHRWQLRSSDGSPYLRHPLQVATAVADWGLDEDAVVAAVLHDVIDNAPRLRRCMAGFGGGVETIVNALTPDAQIPDRNDRRDDLYRRVIAAMRQIGAAPLLIKLADRVHDLSESSHLPEQALARLEVESEKWLAPMAGERGLVGLADWLLGGPAAWSTAARRVRCEGLSALTLALLPRVPPDESL